MEWISVKDRLPKEKCECLIVQTWIDRKDVKRNSVEFAIAIVSEMYDSVSFYALDGDDGEYINVTHWMEKPEPPPLD